MLLKSHRHASADIELWSELHDADLVYSSRPAFQRKERDAFRVVSELGSRKCYVSISWGKDSLVLAHLAWRASLPHPVYRIKMTGIEPADETDRVEQAFLSTFDGFGKRYQVIEQSYIPGERPADMKREPALTRGIRECRRLSGCDCYVNGLRAAESSTRWFAMLRGSINSVSPIGWWSDADVFGYIAKHDLPVHANYAMLGGGRWPRDRLRVCMIGGDKGTRSGRREWEREYYSDVLNRIS